MDCIFCRIIAGEIPAKKVYEDDYCLAFYDIQPQAPVHVIIIPKTHIISASDITAQNSVAIGKIFEAVAKIADELKLDKGYRVVTNCGKDGGQTVAHLHFHLLGGRSLSWPPG